MALYFPLIFIGGYKLELLDSDGKFLRSLTSGTTDEGKAEWITGDTTAQYSQVRLPKDLECDDCTIRVVRQALEFGEVEFWSCADVDIVGPGSFEDEDRCSGRGQFNSGTGQ